MLLTFSIIIAIVLGLGAAGFIESTSATDRAAEACWRALSENLDYDYDPGGLLQGPALSGSVEGLSISADTFFQAREGRKQLFTRFVITGEGLPESLEGIGKPAVEIHQRRSFSLKSLADMHVSSSSILARRSRMVSSSGCGKGLFGTRKMSQRRFVGSLKLPSSCLSIAMMKQDGYWRPITMKAFRMRSDMISSVCYSVSSLGQRRAKP